MEAEIYIVDINVHNNCHVHGTVAVKGMWCFPPASALCSVYRPVGGIRTLVHLSRDRRSRSKVQQSKTHSMR
jgi:hypothetical protein